MSDILRLIAGGLLALCSCYAGVMIKRHYAERHKFYKAAAQFASALSGELSFKKTPLPEIIEKFGYGRRDIFAKLLSEYMCATKRGEGYDKMIKNIDVAHVRENEKKEVISFLCDLGKTSLDDQLALVSRAGKQFELAEKRCADESKKLGGMYFKLAVLVGLALIVIFA